MGKLFYGNGELGIDIDDRLLAHAKVVIATKLRRNESFTLSWSHPGDAVGSRSTIWLQPSIPLRFVFDCAEPAKIDSRALQQMANDANSSRGLILDGDLLEPESVKKVTEQKKPLRAVAA